MKRTTPISPDVALHHAGWRHHADDRRQCRLCFGDGLELGRAARAAAAASAAYYAIPSWQTNINMTANQGSTTMRNIPDVALTADNVYVIDGNGGSGVVGGTSCAAPLWAGFTALVNQQAAASRQPAGRLHQSGHLRHRQGDQLSQLLP